MSRMDINGTQTTSIEINQFQGLNNAQSFDKVNVGEARGMLNMLPNSIGSLAKRPGTIAISGIIGTTDYTDNSLSTICNLYHNDMNTILGVSYKQLLSYNPNPLEGVSNWGGVLMNVPFTTPNVDYAQFKDENGAEVLVLADGGNLKAYDGYLVDEIVPASNDATPLPANDLANINTKKPTGCLIHNTRVVLWNNSDTIWHSKIGYYDYYPQVDFQRFVRENDTVQTCISYSGALLVFMKRHIGVLLGQDRDNWSQDFLDTVNGCLAPKSVQTVIFPDGKQEIFYVSRNGVHSVYTINTLNLDSSARYSTKDVTKMKIEWDSLGATEDEWKNAVAHFFNGKYWLIYKVGTTYKGLVFDTVSESWYPIDNVKANDFYSDGEKLYFVGPDARLMDFDETCYSDYGLDQKINGVPINAYWTSTLLTPKVTGHNHFWDILTVKAKQFNVPSAVDIEVNTYTDQYSQPSALKTATLIWGVTEWGESEWGNQKLTDIINNPKRLRTFLKGQYAQVKFSNNRDEPIELYGFKYEIRPTETY